MKSVWENFYSKKTCLLQVGGKVKHASDLITAIGFMGPCTTREAAKFILSKSKGYDRISIRDIDSRSIDKMYRKRIAGEKEKKVGDKIIQRESVGLVEHGYLFVYQRITNEKSRPVNKYFLTLKGCFFVLGNKMSDKDLDLFIKNASKNYLFFKYLYKILEHTSIKLVREIFVKPVQKLIKKDRIDLDDGFEDTFALIGEKIGQEVFEQYGGFATEYSNMIENNWYDGTGNKNWKINMIALYYKFGDERDLFWRKSDMTNDPRLLYKVMSTVHAGYYSLFDLATPVKHKQRLPKLTFTKFAYPKGVTKINAKKLFEYRKSKGAISEGWLF